MDKRNSYCAVQKLSLFTTYRTELNSVFVHLEQLTGSLRCVRACGRACVGAKWKCRWRWRRRRRWKRKWMRLLGLSSRQASKLEQANSGLYSAVCHFVAGSSYSPEVLLRKIGPFVHVDGRWLNHARQLKTPPKVVLPVARRADVAATQCTSSRAQRNNL